jgi:hypothetical protein
MIAIAHYDNLAQEPLQPGAAQRGLLWSEQSWDEMFIPWFEYTVDGIDLTKGPAPRAPARKKKVSFHLVIIFLSFAICHLKTQPSSKPSK